MNSQAMKNTIKGILIIFAVGALVYFISIRNGFIGDDEELIVNNTVIHSLSNWPIFFTGRAYNFSGTGSDYFRPLLSLTNSFVYSLSGPKPAAFHLLSILLQIMNAILVFLILKKFFKNSIPIILSLLFLVHPLYSEVVFYIADLQDLLFFFFGMLSLYMTIRYPKYLMFITVLLLFSLLSKETGIIFLGIVLLYTVFFDPKRTKPITLAALISLAVYSFLRFGIAKMGLINSNINPLANNLGVRLLNLPKVAIYYLQNLVYPYNLGPNQYWLITTPTIQNFWLPLIILLGFLAIIAVPALKKNKVFTFFLLIFLISFVFLLQIFPLDAMVSGRWFYLPMFGILGMIGSLIPKINKYALIPVVAIIAILSVITVVRSYDWEDMLTLYSHDIKIVKSDPVLENNLAVELLRIGKTSEAGYYFQDSVNLAPYGWVNWNNLGSYEESLGNFTKAEADYKKAIDNGNFYSAYKNYANLLFKEGKITEAKAFLKEKALLYFPEDQSLRSLYLYLQNHNK
jgi:hypothetical protein